MKKLTVLILLLCSCEKEKQPKIGEKRIYNIMLSIEPNNPFMEGDTVEVRNVKNGYVEFIILNYHSGTAKSGYIDNASIEVFNRYTRKIE